MAIQNENSSNVSNNGTAIKVSEEESVKPLKTNETDEVTNGKTVNGENGLANKSPDEKYLVSGKNGKYEVDDEDTVEDKNGHIKISEETESLVGGPVRRVSEIADELLSTGETACGIWCLKGKTLQRFANKKAYVLIYGILGCVVASSYAYLNAIITTIEKRFKIPTTRTGIILVGGDISQLALCLILNYYGGRGHRPRWIAYGIFTVVIYCMMNSLPHLLYGPGEEALDLTVERGANFDKNMSDFLKDIKIRETLCRSGEGKCDDTTSTLMPQVILFSAQLVSGVGSSLYYTLGVSYMDDNIKKSKTPALVSFSYFLRMLGPAFGYWLASWCLSLYISPSLTPTIDPTDLRWLGAWWMGWLVIGSLLAVFALVLAMFPRSLPRAAARRVIAAERRRAGLAVSAEDEEPQHVDPPTSIIDMVKTYQRLFKNKTLICNTLASVFYFMGYMPYWTFMPKYIETIYKQSASKASFYTGSVGLVFTAIGILVSGVFISKFKPSARFLAAWNVVVGAISIAGIVSYAFIGCPVNDQQGTILPSGQLNLTQQCNSGCRCDFVKYSPVCSPDGRTFISPCHAGCGDYSYTNDTKEYINCTCARPGVSLKEGACPTDCTRNFYIFLAIVCFLKFSGATGRTSNFLVSVRCVDEKDKSPAMAFGVMFLSIFAFIPSPILFGKIIDMTCIVWGKTCSGKGNCWLYDPERLRYILNFTSAFFITIGTLFDYGVWYYVKDLKIFDEEVELDVVPQRTKTQRK